MMGFRPEVGGSVLTPDGRGVVVERVGLPDGNGARVLLTERVVPQGRALPVYNNSDLSAGPPLTPFDDGQFVTVPGGHPGQVVSSDGDTVICAFTSRPRLNKRASFPHWRLIVSDLTGR